MDIFAHTLWTTAAARKAKIETEKKGKILQMKILWTAFWGIFPDLFAFTLPFVISFYKVASGAQGFGSFSTRHQVADGFTLSHTLYQYSHSLIIFMAVFLIVWLIYRHPRWELLGWLLHILIDIPSHPLVFFPTPFLFPISNYHYPYGVAWSNKWFMIINYTALLFLWGGFLFKEHRKRKQVIK